MNDLILANARLSDGRITDISIKDGVITHIGGSKSLTAEQRINCRNRLCIPAALDMHVHMRDGIQEMKEDWSSGTRAAVAGGVAGVVDQPNTIPPMDTAERFIDRVREANKKSYCHFGINGAVTEGSDFSGLWKSGALAFGEMFAAASSYGSALTKQEIKTAVAAITALGAVVTVHAEEVLTSDVHTLKEHESSRPITGEAAAIDVVNSLAPKDAHLHYCHISGAESIPHIRGTFEVAPHHLFLSWEKKRPQDTFFRMNPPLRSKDEQLKLWKKFDKIPVIASDHAPHIIAEKAEPFSSAPSGVPGVETMLPLLMNAWYEGKISLDQIILKTVTNPYKILGLKAPGLTVGSRADIAVYDNKPKTIRAEHLHYKCGWTPYERMKGLFPTTTIVGGVAAWHKNEFMKGGGEWLCGKGILDRCI